MTGLLVRQLVARGSQQAWSALSHRTQKRLRHDAKKPLTVEVVQRMTVAWLHEPDGDGEVSRWLQTIERLLDG